MCSSVTSYICPTGVLNNDPITIGILKCLSLLIPVLVKSFDRFISCCPHLRQGLVPGVFLRKVEDQEIVLGRGSASLMVGVASKFEVVRTRGVAKHNAIEIPMAAKLVKNLESETLAVELSESSDVICRSRNPKMACLHCNDDAGKMAACSSEEFALTKSIEQLLARKSAEGEEMAGWIRMWKN